MFTATKSEKFRKKMHLPKVVENRKSRLQPLDEWSIFMKVINEMKVLLSN